MTTNNSGDFTNLNQAADAQHWVDLMRDMTRLFPDIVETREHMLKWVTEHPGTQILDGGCGPGDTTREIAHSVPEATSVTGIDFSDSMIAFANTQNNPKNVHFQSGDLTNLTFEDHTFDAVRVERVLHHIPQAEKAVQEIFRVLKPGGRCALDEPDFSFTRVSPLPSDLAHDYAQRYSDSNANGAIGSDLHALAQATGFEVKAHKATMYLGKDFKKMDASFQAIQILRDLLKEKHQPELMQAIEAAAEQGTFYWAPCYFHIYLQKPA